MSARYTEILSDVDLALLARAGSVPGGSAAADALRVHPFLIGEALSRRSTFRSLGLDSHVTSGQAAALRTGDTAEAAVAISDRLRLALVVHRCAADLVRSAYLADRLGDRVLLNDAPEAELVQVVASTDLKIRLTELLSSYLQSNDVRLLPTDSPLDPSTEASDANALMGMMDASSMDIADALSSHEIGALIELLDGTPIDAHAGIYRRLGDLALFVTGIFPDHGETRSVDARLWSLVCRTVPVSVRERLETTDPQTALGGDTLTALLTMMGPIWYRTAARGISWPALADPLHRAADEFDATAQFLTIACGRHLMEVRDELFGFSLV